ncbi:unnamed protein product [Jaminaea pallidilutea]
MAGVNPYASAAATSAAQASSTYKHPSQLASARLRLSPNRLLYPPSTPVISDKLYSGFVEHLGRGIYGGIVDLPTDPSPANLLEPQPRGRLGWRKDVMRVMSKELEMPILRWPGGNFVSNYHWQDGIGPLEKRPKRIELAWGSTESNLFGTDEFIDYCRGLNVEPYLCLNMGTGTYEEALAWLEYCNGTGDTYWANLRRQNTGRDEPHNVRYWGLGNEVHGAWQVGAMSATDYTTMAKRWAHGLKLVDPSIMLVSCGNQGNSEWDREVLSGLIGVIDLHSIHLYTMLGHDRYSDTAGFEYEKNVFGAAAAERGIEICSSLIQLAKIERAGQVLDWSKRDDEVAARDVKICYDEWNVWDEVKAPANNGLEQTYDFVDMLGVAAWLHVLVRKHREVGMACIAQSVNVISPLMTSRGGLLFQTTYWPLQLFARHMKGGHLLNLGYSGELYTGPTYPTWIRHMTPPPYVDLLGMTGPDGIRLSIINRHPTSHWLCLLDFEDFATQQVEMHEVYADDLAAANTFERPEVVVPTVKSLAVAELLSAGLDVRPHSFVFLIINGRSDAT